MQIHGAVDGTGPYSDGEYSAAFRTSHVRRIHQTFSWGTSLYLRGPGLDGSSTDERAEAIAARIISLDRALKGKSTVFLSGYSRGGAAVLHAAHLLSDAKIRVKAMFLFDAVDRAPASLKTKVPANVATCYHALRADSARSRTSFGHCGLTTASEKTRYKRWVFAGTHGAIGGMPQTIANASGTVSDEDPISADKKIGAGLAVGRVLGPAAGAAAWATAELVDRAMGALTSTNITPESNRKIADAVWGWMSQYVRTERSS